MPRKIQIKLWKPCRRLVPLHKKKINSRTFNYPFRCNGEPSVPPGLSTDVTDWNIQHEDRSPLPLPPQMSNNSNIIISRKRVITYRNMFMPHILFDTVNNNAEPTSEDWNCLLNDGASHWPRQINILVKITHEIIRLTLYIIKRLTTNIYIHSFTTTN